MKYDYLVIGQGLAGSILAYELQRRGRKIALIDERNTFSSSRVAAGLVNPFTGPRMAKSWKAEVLFPYMKDYYIELERLTKASFFSERTIYRPFASIKELNDWDGRSAQPNYTNFIKKICDKNVHCTFVHDPFGGVEIEGFVLNVATFIDAMYQYLNHSCTYIEDQFVESDLEISDNDVSYRGIEASRVVFCSGHKMQHSKLFGWLPLAPVKGEILKLKMDVHFETIYNQSCFIIPLGNGFYKAGSTYDRNDLTIEPTEKGKNEITEKLNTLLKMNFKIVDHIAGIRPGTVTRRPLLGSHPVHKHISIFNGLGTKGVSLAPFFGNHLAKCLVDGNNVSEEVDIKKYYSLYFKSHLFKKN